MSTEFARSGGDLIPQVVFDDMLAQLSSDNVLRRVFPASPLRPLTRRERIRARFFSWRYRVALAVEALRGRHECGFE
jgi:hypothetical protein